MRLGILILILAAAVVGTSRGAVTLPMRTVFKGQDRFEQLVLRAKAENWKMLPIGERTSVVGQAMVGTPYRSYTLEIDNRVESPSVNFTGLDCWTFFEAALAFARMLDEPETNWTPAQLLHYIEIDRSDMPNVPENTFLAYTTLKIGFTTMIAAAWLLI